MCRSGGQTIPHNRLWSVIVCLNFYASGICFAYIADRNQVFTFQDAPQNGVWPLPRHQTYSEGQELLTVDPVAFRLVPWPPEIGSECDIIREAVDRYSWLVAPDKKGSKDPRFRELKQLNISVDYYQGDEYCGYPQLNDNETYYLRISSEASEAMLSSPTVWGMLRGLETFSQMVYKDRETNSYFVNATTVEDWPMFSHRGILLDTARHFIRLKKLLKNLDAMAYNKMNVFHWHIVDDQSFPFESKVFPNLTKLGAYSPKHVYSQEDIREVVRYARLRGIRVLPEFDSPGHARSIGRAMPELMTECHSASSPVKIFTTQKPAPSSNLDPTKNETYDFMRIILSEVKSIFPDNYVHLGMDEVNVKCWLSNPKIQRFLADHKFSSKDLEQYYAERLINVAQSLGYRYMIWSDPLENGVEVSEDTVVQLWKADWTTRAREVALRNHKIVLSSCWYLDLIEYGEVWTKYYKCNPLLFTRKASERQLMLGGEACLWAEYIDNTNVLQILWPSASAVAERLWNGNEDLYPDDQCRKRFDQQRCRMLRRGIPARPVYSGFCDEDNLNTEPEQKFILEVPFETRQSIVFVWVFVAISVLCSLYWVTLSRPLLRSICRKSLFQATNRNHHRQEYKPIRT